MNLQGFIKSMGTPREWNTKEGEKRETYPMVLTVPYIGHDGKEHSDDVLAELTAGNPQYITNVKKAMEERKRMEFRLGFSIREYNGKQYQDCRMWDVQIMM